MEKNVIEAFAHVQEEREIKGDQTAGDSEFMVWLTWVGPKAETIKEWNEFFSETGKSVHSNKMRVTIEKS